MGADEQAHSDTSTHGLILRNQPTKLYFQDAKSIRRLVSCETHIIAKNKTKVKILERIARRKLWGYPVNLPWCKPRCLTKKLLFHYVFFIFCGYYGEYCNKKNYLLAIYLSGLELIQHIFGRRRRSWHSTDFWFFNISKDLSRESSSDDCCLLNQLELLASKD